MPNRTFDRNRCLQQLGLARRASALLVGTDAVLAGLAAGSALQVWLAVDAGTNVTKKIRDKCAFYHKPLVQLLSRKELGEALGRSQVVVVAVTNPGFAASLQNALGESDGGVLFDKTESV